MIYIIAKNPAAVINWLLGMVFICLWFWSGSNALLFNSYITQEKADIILKIQTIGWASFPTFYVIFLLYFMKKESILKNVFVLTFFFAMPFIFEAAAFSDKMLVCCDRTSFGLTGIWGNSAFVYLFIAYCFVMFAVSLGMLVLFRHRQKNVNMKKSADIILATTIMAFSITLIVSFILKWFRIHVPLEANLVFLIFVTGIIYAAGKYDFFEINAEQAADRILESVDEGLILTDIQGVVMQANSTAKQMLDIEFKAEKDNISEIIQDEKITAMILSGEKFTGIELSRGSGKSEKMLTLSCTHVEKNGEKLGNLCVIDDVTEKKAAERGLEKTMKDLERSNVDLERFAYVVSHDLKEPLRMVSNYMQLLKKKSYDRLESEDREYIDFAVDGALRMNELIKDLLDYSRVNTRGGKFEPVDLNDAAEHIINIMKFKIEDAKARILIPQRLPSVTGDGMQIEQVLQNLIENGLKFRSKSGIPVIEITAQENASSVILTVKDNGIGIEQRFQDRIFEIFQRLHSREEYEGTGIGLAICKRIMERHGGKIRVESEGDNKGSVFVIEFKR
ncbi:MAG: GHKL domain-containing protein [Candidatus Goldbacteria bacterium]|nr:GHKL domain-containing protein [Candidatus Goldiibacteriota bacterium]